MAGEFSQFNAAFASRLTRLNSDGSIDPTFAAISGINGPIFAMALNPDGTIYVAGNFTAPRARVARFNPDGSLDAGFDPGRGPDGAVLALAVQADGNLLIGGSFTNVNGVGRRGLARLRGTVNLLPIAIQNIRLNAGQVAFDFTSEFGRNYNIEISSDLVTWTILDTRPGAGFTTTFLDPLPPVDLRFYRIRPQ